MKKALTISNASVGYRNGKKTVLVVDGIDASLQSCELVALIGRNGAGKSTLLRTLSAFQKPLSGTVECGGRNIVEMSPNDVAKELAVVLTSTEPAPLTVKELVSLGRTPYTNFLGKLTPKDEGIVNAAMELMGGTLEDTVVFEDAHYAVKGAKSVGFTVYAVLDEVVREDDIDKIKEKADHCIYSYKELLK